VVPPLSLRSHMGAVLSLDQGQLLAREQRREGRSSRKGKPGRCLLRGEFAPALERIAARFPVTLAAEFLTRRTDVNVLRYPPDHAELGSGMAVDARLARVLRRLGRERVRLVPVRHPLALASSAAPLAVLGDPRVFRGVLVIERAVSFAPLELGTLVYEVIPGSHAPQVLGPRDGFQVAAGTVDAGAHAAEMIDGELRRD